MSAIAFLVDECLPVDVTRALRARGYDVADICERGFRGTPDDGVWALAVAESRILVTRDLDFPLRGTAARPPGLVLLRAPDHTTAVQLGALAGALLDAIDAAGLAGQITIVSPGRFRQRPWSPG